MSLNYLALPCSEVTDPTAADDNAPVDGNGGDGEGGDDDEDGLKRRLKMTEDGIVSPLPSLVHNLNLVNVEWFLYWTLFVVRTSLLSKPNSTITKYKLV